MKLGKSRGDLARKAPAGISILWGDLRGPADKSALAAIHRALRFTRKALRFTRKDIDPTRQLGVERLKTAVQSGG